MRDEESTERLFILPPSAFIPSFMVLARCVDDTVLAQRRDRSRRGRDRVHDGDQARANEHDQNDDQARDHDDHDCDHDHDYLMI
jgi:hypothetical protein